MNVSFLIGWPAAVRAVFRKRDNWCIKTCCEKGCMPAFSSTTVLGTPDINEAGMCKILRRHRATKPSTRRRCTVTSQNVARPYRSLDSTKERKNLIFSFSATPECPHNRCNWLKSALAVPSLRDSSESTRPSFVYIALVAHIHTAKHRCYPARLSSQQKQYTQ